MSINIIVGCMFGGKSTELHKRFRTTFQKHPSCTVCFVPSIDNRYSKNALSVSHDGSRIYASHIDSLTLDPVGIENATNIFIDEGQFLEGLADFCIRQKLAGKHITVAALSSDFMGKAWPEIQALVPVHVSNYTALTAVCVVCRQDAFYSRKLVASSTLVDVGGSDKYVAVCLKHFKDTTPIPTKTLDVYKSDLNKLIVN